MKICVLGAGIIGMGVAVRLIDSFPESIIDVISDQFSPDTTGDGSAGLWAPYLIDEGDAKLHSWFKETYDYLADLNRTEVSALLGVQQISGYLLYESKQEVPKWRDIPHSIRTLSDQELEKFGPNFKFGWFLTTYTAECTKLLPYFMKRFTDKGGRLIEKKVQRLEELYDGTYDVIINCTGVRANSVTPDPEVYPIRGQVIKVRAPWVKHFVINEEPNGNYIIPNIDTVVLGGTAQVGNWNLNPCPEDRKKIWEGCCQMMPNVEKSEVIKDWVGLRPGRKQIRMESESVRAGNKVIKVIHNYGHGGSGVNLFWGCAREIVDMVRKHEALTKSEISSKL